MIYFSLELFRKLCVIKVKNTALSHFFVLHMRNLAVQTLNGLTGLPCTKNLSYPYYYLPQTDETEYICILMRIPINMLVWGHTVTCVRFIYTF